MDHSLWGRHEHLHASDYLSRTAGKPKQIPHGIVLDRHVQIARRDAHVGVPRGVSDLGQRPTAGQGMADERVPPVVDRQAG